MFHENQQIGSYTLIRKLGKGGFGEVWLAERKSKFVTTKVAVKLPLDEQIDHETIKQEAQLWEQASGHPNILPIIDADEYDGQIVIVSEYAPDGSLDEWLKRNGVMPIEKAVEMTIKILDGLEFLHSRNIIHRDLKPANILLQGETPRLAAECSRALRATASSQSSNVSGTFAYMPPEGFDGKRSVQTDVWSVGVNLYQFLTGTLPFPQKEPSALIAAIMMRDFEPLPLEVPQNLQNVIAKALARQPENRYASAAAMREDLRQVLRGEAVSNLVQSDLGQTFATEQITQQKGASNFAQNVQGENETVVRSAPNFGQIEKRKTSNIWMYATLALALVSVISLGVYFFVNQSKQNNSNKSEVAQISATQSSNTSVNSENINVQKISNVNTVTPIPTPDKAQLQRTINSYVSKTIAIFNKDELKGIPKEERADAFKYTLDGKKVVYSDVDKDNDEDAVAVFSFCESRRCHTTTHSSYLVVFLNNNGQFNLTSELNLQSLYADIKSVKDGKILVETTNLNLEIDPDCCPSDKKLIIYSFVGNKLFRGK